MSALGSAPGFRQSRTGFWVTFDNGYTVSVQWSDHHYCTRQAAAPVIPDWPMQFETAEVAIFDKDQEFVRQSHGDDVIGHRTPADVLKIMIEVAAWPKVGT